MSRITKSRALSAGVAASLAAAALVGVAGSANAAVGTSGKALPALGSEAGGTVVTVTGTGFKDAAGVSELAASGHKVVTGATPVCSSTGTPITKLSVVSATKAVLTVPTATISTGTTLKAMICLDIAATTGFVAVPYTYAKQPVEHATAFMSATSGPMAGGQVLTLATTDAAPWQPGASVLIGGQPVTSVSIAPGGKTLTAVTPVSTTDGEKDIVVRTPGFADVDRLAASEIGYTYTRAIKVAPQTAVTGKTTPITITGAGFKAATYTVTPAVGFTVTLDGAADVTCDNVQVVSDTEATCDVPSTAASDVYKVVINDGQAFAAAGGKNVLSTGSVLTIADF